MLDGLHEDLNKIINKPTTTDIESDGRLINYCNIN